MPIGWKTLDERKATQRTCGASALTFCTSKLAQSRPVIDQPFQFVYVQKNVAVGASCSFVLRERSKDDQDESLTSDTGEDLRISSQKRKNKVKPASYDWGRRDVGTSERKYDRTSDESFIVVALPSFHVHSETGGDLQSLFTHELRERDKMARMYEREKAISIEQSKRNEELQKQHSRALKENWKMKEELKQLETEIEAIKARETRIGMLTLGGALPVILPSEDTQPAASYIEGLQAICNEESCSQNSFDEGGSSSLFTSQVDVLECPVCLARFDKRQGSTKFQHHVHSHFSEEDTLH